MRKIALSIKRTTNHAALAPLFIFLCFGCIPNTKITGGDFCSVALKEGDHVLVNAFSFRNWEYQLDMVRKEMKRLSVKSSYVPEEEWNLRAAGIVNPLDSTNYRMLLQKGITHLLLIRQSSSQEGNLYAYKTPHEVSLEYTPNLPPQSQNAANVEVVFQLLSLKSREMYAFKVDTVVGGVEVREDDGGRSTVNPGGTDKARNVAIRKGIKRISENCR